MKHLVDYSISIIEPRIFAVVIKDKYERGMTFCRVQEFYESPNRKFRGKTFSMWDYMDWYAKKNGKGFSYAADWSGYNVPVEVIVDCYHGSWIDPKKPKVFETPYDQVMSDILADITHEVGASNCLNGYIMGTDRATGDLFEHELCHARYYTDSQYRKLVNSVTKKIKKGLPDQYQQLKKNIIEMGYASRVVDDEIQAYMQHGVENPKFRKDIPLSVLKTIRQMYVDTLAKNKVLN
jgi:hypothetical protein